jgi:hypothetical protein
LAVLSAGLLAGLAVSLGPAQAALTCAPDAYEKDSVTAAAALTVDAKMTRAICQAPTPQPRIEAAWDEDYFVFTATAGSAYTVQAVDLGAALANDKFDRGGIQLRVARLNADGTITTIEQDRGLNGDRVITPALAAGRYSVLAYTNDMQVYPDNTMDVKTVQGSEGIYAVSLTESTPGPVVTSPSPSPSPSPSVSAGEPVAGTDTLSAPAPSGGMIVASGAATSTTSRRAAASRRAARRSASRSRRAAARRICRSRSPRARRSAPARASCRTVKR